MIETAARRPRIVVGVDGSEPARRALLWAAEEARLRDADLEVVHAWQHPTTTFGLVLPADDRAAAEAYAATCSTSPWRRSQVGASPWSPSSSTAPRLGR